LHPHLFGTIENPIRMMQREHQRAGDEMRVIRALTNDYVRPADGCTTYRVTFEELAQFDHDLHRHVHLENNVLFPKAIALEHGPGRASSDDAFKRSLPRVGELLRGTSRETEE
jgi:hemerythrin-like domain-containing protein